MKRKLPIILVASSAIMLAASTIGSTKATLTYMSCLLYTSPSPRDTR